MPGLNLPEIRRTTPSLRLAAAAAAITLPLALAACTLQPAAPADLKLWPMGFPTAMVQSDGKFHFSCFAENDGAPEGEYKLLVTWMEGDGIPNEDPEAPKPQNRVDAKYASAESTPLTVTVEKKANQIPRIEIP